MKGTNTSGSAHARSLATAQISSYYNVIRGDHPQGYWRLGDAFDTSTLTDSSGNGYDGEYKNGAHGTAGSPQPVGGVGGGTAAVFTGDGTYGYINNFQAPQHAYTMEIWFYPMSTRSQMLFQQGGAGAIWINGAGQLAYRQVDNFTDSEIDYTLPVNFALNSWHQVVASWNGLIADLYLDGVQVGQLSVHDPVSGAGTIHLGYGTFAPWFAGYLNEAAYYSYALTPAQVLTHFHADPALHLPASVVGTGERHSGGNGGPTHHGGPTTAQKLKTALAKCRKLKNKRARAKCTAAAKKRYSHRK